MFGYVFDFKEKEESDHPFDTERIISQITKDKNIYSVNHVIIADTVEEKKNLLGQVQADIFLDAKDVTVAENKLMLHLAWDNLYTALNNLKEESGLGFITPGGHVMSASEYLAYLLYVHKRQGDIALELSHAMAYEYISA